MRIARLSREDRTQMVAELQRYVEEEWGQSVGSLAAENLLDFVMQVLGPYIYNLAVQDSRDVVLRESERMDEELDQLLQPTNQRRRTEDD